MNLWNMTIACELRLGVASVGIFLYWAWLTLYEITFQVQEMRRWTALMLGRKDEESQHVALKILFVKYVEQTCLTCIFGVKEL